MCFWHEIPTLPVLVLWGCYHKIPNTRWLVNNRDVFLTVLGAGGLRSWCQHGWVRALLQVASYSLYLPHVMNGLERELCGFCIINSIISLASTFITNHLPKCIPNTITFGVQKPPKGFKQDYDFKWWTVLGIDCKGKRLEVGGTVWSFCSFPGAEKRKHSGDVWG